MSYSKFKIQNSKFKILFLVLIANTAVALEDNSVQLKTTPYDVVAPSTYGDPSSSDRVQGQIYYDVTAGAFKGINKSGTPDVLSVSGSSAVTSGGTERVERAMITGGNPPTISSQSGTWLTYSSRTAAGDTSWTITSGIFSAAPTCVCSVLQADATATNKCHIYSTTSTTLRVATSYTISSATATGNDYNFNIICMGPR